MRLGIILGIYKCKRTGVVSCDLAVGIHRALDIIAVFVVNKALIGIVQRLGELAGQQIQRLLIIGDAPLAGGVGVTLDGGIRGELAGSGQQLPLGLERAVEVVVRQIHRLGFFAVLILHHRALAVGQGGDGQAEVGVVVLRGGLFLICGIAVRVKVPRIRCIVLLRQVCLVVHGKQLRGGKLRAVHAVDQRGGVRSAGLAVWVGISQLDDELLHGLTAAELLGGVGHIDLHVLGKLVDQHVPLVPQLQRVVAVDLVLADGGVQVPDVGEDAVDLGNVLLIGRHVVLIDLLQAAGVGVELLGQGVRRSTHLNVVQAVAGLVGKLTQLGHQVGELCLDDAEGIVALAHLVQHRLNVLQAA